MAPTSSGAQPRPHGSGLKSSRQLSALPVRYCAFFFMRLTSRSVSTGPGLSEITRMPSRTLMLPKDWLNAVSAALPATSQIYSGSWVCAALAVSA
jgi:hypothetical protein